MACGFQSGTLGTPDPATATVAMHQQYGALAWAEPIGSHQQRLERQQPGKGVEVGQHLLRHHLHPAPGANGRGGVEAGKQPAAEHHQTAQTKQGKHHKQQGQQPGKSHDQVGDAPEEQHLNHQQDKQVSYDRHKTMIRPVRRGSQMAL